MAADAAPAPTTNGTPAANKPLELAITLPSNPHTKIHIHLTLLPTTLIALLTTSTPESPPNSAAFGSYVYAMPDRYNPTQPISTPLYTVTGSLEFAERMAKLLAKKTGKGCYVSWSGDLSGGVQGGSVEEEMEAFRAVVKTVVEANEREGSGHS